MTPRDGCEYELESRKPCGKPVTARWTNKDTRDWFVVCHSHDLRAIKLASTAWTRESLRTEVPK